MDGVLGEDREQRREAIDARLTRMLERATAFESLIIALSFAPTIARERGSVECVLIVIPIQYAKMKTMTVPAYLSPISWDSLGE